MLQSSSMYAYIPALDMVRARQFYEHKLGLKAKQEINGGVVYEFGKRDRVFHVPDAQRRDIEG